MRKAKVELINIGREKFCGIVEVKNQDELLVEVKKHLMSNNVEIFSSDGTVGIVVVGGMREVGQFIVREKGSLDQ